MNYGKSVTCITIHICSREYLLWAINKHVLKPVRAVWAIINERVPSVNIHTTPPLPSLEGSNYRLSKGELLKHISFLPRLD